MQGNAADSNKKCCRHFVTSSSSTLGQTRSHYHGFDLLRVVIAVLVLIENATYVGEGLTVVTIIRSLDFALLGAKVGVELLIMLSGFLLMRDLLDTRSDPIRVLARRLVGLVPLLVIIATIAAILYPETNVRALLTLTYNFETATLGAVGTLLPWWTVFVIVHLAVIWCVLAKAGMQPQGFTRLAIAWIVVATLIGKGLDISDAEKWMEWNYKSTLTRGVGWCVGVLVAIHGVPRLPPHVGKMAIATWALAVLLYVGVNHMQPGIVPWHLIQTLVTFSCFVVLAKTITSNARPNGFWRALSGYTFSLYIVQAPVIWWFARGSDSLPDMGIYTASLACCVIAAIAAEHAVVRPFYRLKPSLRAETRVKQSSTV